MVPGLVEDIEGVEAGTNLTTLLANETLVVSAATVLCNAAAAAAATRGGRAVVDASSACTEGEHGALRRAACTPRAPPLPILPPFPGRSTAPRTSRA